LVLDSVNGEDMEFELTGSYLDLRCPLGGVPKLPRGKREVKREVGKVRTLPNSYYRKIPHFKEVCKIVEVDLEVASDRYDVPYRLFAPKAPGHELSPYFLSYATPREGPATLFSAAYYIPLDEVIRTSPEPDVLLIVSGFGVFWFSSEDEDPSFLDSRHHLADLASRTTFDSVSIRLFRDSSNRGRKGDRHFIKDWDVTRFYVPFAHPDLP
jgi:hypothetical protein